MHEFDVFHGMPDIFVKDENDNFILQVAKTMDSPLLLDKIVEDDVFCDTETLVLDIIARLIRLKVLLSMEANGDDGFDELTEMVSDCELGMLQLFEALCVNVLFNPVSGNGKVCWKFGDDTEDVVNYAVENAQVAAELQ